VARRILLVVLTVLLAGLLYASPAFAQCPDCDGDGHAWPSDCNDADADTYPGATESCDGRDNDCDGLIDNDATCPRSCDYPDRIGEEIRISHYATVENYLRGRSYDSSFAWSGASYGLAWIHSTHQELYVRMTLLDPSGTPLPEDIVVDRPQSSTPTPAVSVLSTGSAYALAWNPRSEVAFRLYDETGLPLGPTNIVV
jgi:hypothetical protein